MISRDHMIKRTCDLVSGSSTVPGLIIIVLLKVEIFLFCHVTSRDFIIKGASDMVGGSPKSQVIAVPNIILRGIVEVKI